MPEAKVKRPLSLSEAHEILSKLDPDKSDQLQKRTLDYTTEFSRASAEVARTAKRRLVKEASLSEEEAVEVINILPETTEELRAIAAGWKRLLTTEALQSILAILKEERK